MNLCRSGFLGDICNGIKQGFKEAVTFIADAIICVVNEIVDALTGKKYRKQYYIILTVKGGTTIRSDLFISIIVRPYSEAKASATFKLDYCRVWTEGWNYGRTKNRNGIELMEVNRKGKHGSRLDQFLLLSRCNRSLIYLVQPFAEAGVAELTLRAPGGHLSTARVSLTPPGASGELLKGPTIKPYHKLEMTSPK